MGERAALSIGRIRGAAGGGGIGMRVWCSTPDYLGLSWDMTEAVKARFDDVGISIPFPQREIVQRAA